MKVLIYCNKEKDFGGTTRDQLVSYLTNNQIEYQILDDNMLKSSITADLLFAIGGDGTILCLAEFANTNNVPIIGINAGKLGFLCEFEKDNVEDAVDLFKSGKYIQDKRSMVSLECNGKTYNALNEIYIQRIYDPALGNTIAGIQIDIDNEFISKYRGDGVIISTPTGSTAYAFSLGAPILSPQSEVFTMTPIAPHSFNQRPIVYSSNSTCKITFSGKGKVGVFADGKLVEYLTPGQFVKVTSMGEKIVFLRKKDFNFFKRLSYKMYKNSGGKDWWVKS